MMAQCTAHARVYAVVSRVMCDCLQAGGDEATTKAKHNNSLL